jgi:hypothetical protein
MTIAHAEDDLPFVFAVPGTSLVFPVSADHRNSCKDFRRFTFGEFVPFEAGQIVGFIGHELIVARLSARPAHSPNPSLRAM